MLRRKNLHAHAVEKPRRVRRHIRRLVRPIVEVVVAEQPDVRHENARIDVYPVHPVEVVPAIRFRQIAIRVVEIPLSPRSARVIARRRLRIQSKLRHHARAHVVVVKISADAKLRHLHFVRSKHFARPADRVVLRMIEVVHVVDVRANFRREKFRIHRRILRPRSPVEPSPIRKRKRLRLLRLCRSSLRPMATPTRQRPAPPQQNCAFAPQPKSTPPNSQPSPHSPPPAGHVRAQHCCPRLNPVRAQLSRRSTSARSHRRSSSPRHLVAAPAELRHFACTSLPLFFPAPLFASNSSTLRSNNSTRSSNILSRSSKPPARQFSFPTFVLATGSAFAALSRIFRRRIRLRSAIIPKHASRRAQTQNPRHTKHTNPLHILRKQTHVSLPATMQSNLDRQRRAHALAPQSPHRAHTRVGRASDWRQAQPTSLPSYVRETAVRKHKAQR